MQITKSYIGDIEVIRLENKTLSIDLAPTIGGRIVSIYSKILQKEFLWNNKELELKRYPIGTDYDPCFFGGIDELLPNDIPEVADGLEYPDHGELWTMELNSDLNPNSLKLFGKLPISELYYEKTISIEGSTSYIHIDYTIRNEAGSVRNFLWKLHAALNISQCDQMECFAKKGQVVDPNYSRFKSNQPFNWPMIEGTDASIVPANDGSMDFYYLFETQKGEMSLISQQNDSRFTYYFDTKIFPYLWYFASYGGFWGHYTAILEPCTAMPISVNEAAGLKQCTTLMPGQSIKTRVSIYAGSLSQPPENYI